MKINVYDVRAGIDSLKGEGITRLCFTLVLVLGGIA